MYSSAICEKAMLPLFEITSVSGISKVKAPAPLSAAIFKPNFY
jgi:hypothetical protein